MCNCVLLHVHVCMCLWPCVCVCIPPQSSSGTRQLVGESRPSGWTRQPPAVCHLSYAQTQISSSLATSIHKWFMCVCVCVVDGHVNKSKSRSWSLKREPSRHSTMLQWRTHKQITDKTKKQCQYSDRRKPKEQLCCSFTGFRSLILEGMGTVLHFTLSYLIFRMRKLKNL